MRLHFHHLLAALLCLAGLLGSSAGRAGDTDLANKPLANATTATILPNIMLDLDNSGSMVWDYMPDYVRMRSDGIFEAWCRDIEGGFQAVCEQGDPLYFAAAFNKAYYNPNVRYQWPVNADGRRRPDRYGRTSYGDAAAWAEVPSDGYQVQAIDKLTGEHAKVLEYWENWRPKVVPCYSIVVDEDGCSWVGPNTKVNLVSEYPERKWCSGGKSPVCKSAISNGTYRYPDQTYATLQVALGAPYYYNVRIRWCSGPASDRNRTCQSRRTGTYHTLDFSDWQRVDIREGQDYPKGPARTDCAQARCSYAEEMSNFATWYAWYRTRAQMAKSSIGHAFAEVRGVPKTGDALQADPDDPNFFHARIGLTTINLNPEKTTTPINLPIKDFEGAAKTDFYTSLYGFIPRGGTPLRASLNEVGKMYDGTSTVYTSDPIQHSCQRNFAILATDGYWNGEDSDVPDLDSDKAVPRPSYMPTPRRATAKTLADVAYYYYHTDLRDGMENNVPSAGTNTKTDDVATHQHMTTFTLGLGVDGTLGYRPDYKSAGEGDYYDIVQGPKANWPWPNANEQTTIDDLWHAAVNGRGTYFSAQDPVALEEGMRKALGSIEQADGSGAAAATSNLQPTAGDNFIYIANYRTGLWDGELAAHDIDLQSGEISSRPHWQASTLLAGKINADGTDTRTIWTSNAQNQLVPFRLTADGSGLSRDHFATNRLSQYATWSAEQRTAATPEALVSFLRGHDPKVRVGEVATRLFRERLKLLGDFVHSQPVYVKMAPHNYSDDGYAGFKTATARRDGMVYAAANDGMLHAFDAATGAERWAYIPPLLLPDLWRLADVNYGDNHRYYLDGPLAVSDAFLGEWKTVLVGAMGKGGRGYYALDITDPARPAVLWTFTAAHNENVGFTYGTPFITKRGGRWVALLTSGYNNVPGEGGFNGGDGKGHLFVVDLATGAEITEQSIATSEGSSDDPSGLARINIVVEDFATDNTAIAAYGGDLKGNLWRFNLGTPGASKLLALGDTMPISVTPEIASIDNQRSVYIATGRYLGTSDLTTTARQAIIGVRDNGSGTVTYPGTLVKQGLSEGATQRSNAEKRSVNWAEHGGWYVELPDTGERVGIDPQLYFGTLLVSSVVPTASECMPGGYSWMYQLDYRSGGFVVKDTPVARWQASPIVGMTVSKLPGGTPVIHGVTADGRRPKVNKLEIAPANSADDTKRLLWRELGF